MSQHCKHGKFNWARCELCELESRIAALTADVKAEGERADIAEAHERELRQIQLTHEAEVSRLREELAGVRAAHGDIQKRLYQDLSTERADREKAEAQLEACKKDREAAVSRKGRLQQAERERDTALETCIDLRVSTATMQAERDRHNRLRLQAVSVRDAALERLKAANQDAERYGNNWAGASKRALAAETALASARELLTDNEHVRGSAIGIAWQKKRDAWLSSAPSPAPCSGCQELKAKLERARTILTSKRVLNPQSQVERALEELR